MVKPPYNLVIFATEEKPGGPCREVLRGGEVYEQGVGAGGEEITAQALAAASASAPAPVFSIQMFLEYNSPLVLSKIYIR